MKLNKRLLMRILEEAKLGSPSGNCTYTRNYFLLKVPMLVQADFERETGEEISLEEAQLYAYLCVEADYVYIPPEGTDDSDDLVSAEKMLRLTLQGYEKLESLEKELE